MSQIVFLNNVRLAHPHLWTPAAPMAGSNSGPKYDGSFIVAPDSQACKDATAAFLSEAQKTFGANYAAIVGAMDKGKKCLRTGNGKLSKEGKISNGFENMMYLVAKNKMKPVTIAKFFHEGKPVHLDESGVATVDGKIVKPAFQVKTPYGGCYVNAKVEIYGMNKPGIQGIYATLLAVQFWDDGESFGGGGAPTADGFEEGDYGHESGSDPFAGNTPAASPANLFG